MIAQIQDIDALFPSREDAAFFGQTCATCHNAHDNTLHSQLRNPTYSTEFFSYVTSSSLSTQYDPNIQLCGQCHNQRGAGWTGSSRPPHHSVQYNIIVGKIAKPGTADEVWNGTMSFHGSQPLQCVQCHTHGHEVESPDDENPNYTGHTFEPVLHGCTATGCHTSESVAQVLWTGAQTENKAAIQRVKGLLDTWATTKASEPLREKYGALAWEFSNEGQLSNPTGDSSIVGPTSAEQSGIPDEIKKARFLLYMIEHDGSYGIHNGDYSRFLLDEAEKLILAAP
jgi:cytochrome c553